MVFLGEPCKAILELGVKVALGDPGRVILSVSSAYSTFMKS